MLLPSTCEEFSHMFNSCWWNKTWKREAKEKRTMGSGDTFRSRNLVGSLSSPVFVSNGITRGESDQKWQSWASEEGLPQSFQLKLKGALGGYIFLDGTWGWSTPARSFSGGMSLFHNSGNPSSPLGRGVAIEKKKTEISSINLIILCFKTTPSVCPLLSKPLPTTDKFRFKADKMGHFYWSLNVFSGTAKMRKLLSWNSFILVSIHVY